MISKKLLSFLMLGVLQTSVMFAMEGSPTASGPSFNCFTLPANSIEMTKLAPGRYHGNPCIVTFGTQRRGCYSGHISLLSLCDPYKTLHWLDYHEQPGRTATILSNGFTRVLYSTKDTHYTDGTHYAIDSWDFEQENSKFGGGQSFPGRGRGLEFENVVFTEFISDNKVALGYPDGSIKIFDTSYASLTLLGLHKGLTCLANLGNNMLASGTAVGSVYLWNVSTNESPHIFEFESKQIISLIKINDATLVIGSKPQDSLDGSLQGIIWNHETNEELATFNYFGNVARIDDTSVIYLKDIETLTFEIYNLETQIVSSFRIFENIRNIKSLYTTEKTLLTVCDNQIVIMVPNREQSQYVFFVSA